LAGALHGRLNSPVFRRVVKNSSYLLSATGISALLGLAQGILTARLLGVNDYGVLGAITLFTSVINNLVSFRMSEVVVKYVGQFSERGDEARAAALFKLAALVEMGASLLAFGLLWLLAPLGARYLAKDASLAGLFAVYGLVALVNLIAESSTGLLQIFDRFKRMAVINLAGNVVTLLIIVVVYVLNGGLTGVALAYLIGKAVGATILSIAALLEARRRWGGGWRHAPLSLLWPLRGELARFALNTNVAASISLVTKDSELLWVSWLRSPVEAGYYKLAMTLTNLVQLPLSPLPQATYPELSRQAARRDWAELRGLLRRGALLAGAYGLAATIFLLLFGRGLIALLYTPEYLPAYPATLIILVGLLAANTFYWRRPALLALGQAGFPTRINLTLALLKLAGILLLVPRYGYLACAALLAAFYLVGTAVTVWKVYTLLPARADAHAEAR
jgi:O-antigen/teichoic acid export membrane protein